LSRRGGANPIDNRQLEIGNDFTLQPLASNDLFDAAGLTMTFAPFRFFSTGPT
jgi:hypothetical protein